MRVSVSDIQCFLGVCLIEPADIFELAICQEAQKKFFQGNSALGAVPKKILVSLSDLDEVEVFPRYSFGLALHLHVVPFPPLPNGELG